MIRRQDIRIRKKKRKEKRTGKWILKIENERTKGGSEAEHWKGMRNYPTRRKSEVQRQGEEIEEVKWKLRKESEGKSA